MPLIRYFILCFLVVVAHATSIKDQLIPNGYIAKENNVFINADDYQLTKETFKNFTVKLEVSQKLLTKGDAYYLHIYCDVESLVKSNVSYRSTLNAILIKLDQSTPKNILISFSYPKEQILNFRVHALTPIEYEMVFLYKDLIFGLAYGIMFSAFLYNLVIFFNSRQRSFLYYSLMQFFLLLILYDIYRFETMTVIEGYELIIIDILEDICMIMTILFSKEILNTKKQMKFINRVLNLFIYLNVVDFVTIILFGSSVLYEYVPRSIIIFVLIVAGGIAIAKGQRSAIFYMLGWLVLFISLFTAEQRLLGIDDLYIIHIGFPLESLILSFALGYKLKQTVLEKNEKERMLIHQSKLASMGEMINNIAHQWRQPLTHLSFINMDLQVASQTNQLEQEYLLNKIQESNIQIDFMSSTIDNFRDFYQPAKMKEKFLLSDAIRKAVTIIQPSLTSSKIKLELHLEENLQIKSYENEYSQVVLNLLTNAKDALIERKIKKPRIKIILAKKKRKYILKVSDNAKGLNPQIVHKVFEPYFSTKRKSSGIGLYMSKVIIESHFKGEISVHNSTQGACFHVIV